MNEKTSKDAASAAARVLRDPSASEDAKSAAGSALTQYEGIFPDSGVSLRDHFAGLALVGILAGNPPYRSGEPYHHYAEDAYDMADAMLEARAK